MGEVLKYALPELFTSNPLPYFLIAGGGLLLGFALLKPVVDAPSMTVPVKAGLVVVAILVMYGAGQWAESEAKSFCAEIRGTPLWTEQHCYALDSDGSTLGY